jgi:hypothetical protein
MTQTLHQIAESVADYIVGPGRVDLLDVISSYDAIDRANPALQELTGIRDFFPDAEALEEFRAVLAHPHVEADASRSREWGDFQTPLPLASHVCRYLAELGVSPEVIIEPTYGAGNFIMAALRSFPAARLVYGVEIQEKYEWHLKTALLIDALHGRRFTAEIVLRHDNVFTHTIPQEVLNAKNFLIVGNPPWITNAELSTLVSTNVPEKRNIKSLNGLDALTGKSNFDLGEFVLLRLLDVFATKRGVLAMLCKNAVIKNIVEQLPQQRYPVANIRALAIDAHREFGAAVEASALVMDLGASQPAVTCAAASLDNPGRVTHIFGWTRDRFVSNVVEYESSAELDGRSPFVWRQGLKHDCKPIVELDPRHGVLFNGNNEVVDVEEDRVYWLLKSSDLKNFEIDQARKKVIVTQRALGEDTSLLRQTTPKLWAYLMNHAEYFERRKSSIYRGKPPFSIFGVGEYSFKPYKVAIAGLYKEPRFSLVLPIDARPVMLDDTCYFVGFDSYVDALFTAALLNSPLIIRFLRAIVFTDAKRPYTKEILMRVDLVRVATRVSFQMLRAFWEDMDFQPCESVAESDYEAYRQRCLYAGKSEQDLQLGFGL